MKNLKSFHENYVKVYVSENSETIEYVGRLKSISEGWLRLNPGLPDEALRQVHNIPNKYNFTTFAAKEAFEELTSSKNDAKLLDACGRPIALRLENVVRVEGHGYAVDAAFVAIKKLKKKSKRDQNDI